jgi:hypothetical protein
VKWHRAFNGLRTGAALLLPLAAAPESRIESGTVSSASSAMAHVNFKIVIPQVLYLRVGVGNDGIAGRARPSVILNTSARRAIAQQAQCTPTAGPAVATAAPHPIVCTASMP